MSASDGRVHGDIGIRISRINLWKISGIAAATAAYFVLLRALPIHSRIELFGRVVGSCTDLRDGLRDECVAIGSDLSEVVVARVAFNSSLRQLKAPLQAECQRGYCARPGESEIRIVRILAEDISTHTATLAFIPTIRSSRSLPTGSDIALSLPVSRTLWNLLLDTRPQASPSQR
jgi:hypothetical protein